MAIEIERKFLIDQTQLSIPDSGEVIKQGYIPTATKTAVRIRLKGEQAFITVKGANRGAVRAEFEYPIPRQDAELMLDTLCEGTVIEKVRYEIWVGEHCWEVDHFHGENEGLMVAEIELEAEEESFEVPAWAVEEVTGDPKYYNANLVEFPYSQWG